MLNRSTKNADFPLWRANKCRTHFYLRHRKAGDGDGDRNIEVGEFWRNQKNINRLETYKQREIALPVHVKEKERRGGSEACRLFSDGAVGRRRSPSKSPEARIMPAARVSVTFRKLAFQRSEDSASLRVPRHQPPLKTRIFLQLKPSQSLASSGNPSHPSPTLSKRSVTSNNPNRPGLRLFPKVSSARSPPL